MRDIPRRISAMRIDRGLSREELAKKIGLSVTQLRRIERGTTRMVWTIFVDLARALDVDLYYLAYETNVSRPFNPQRETLSG